MEYLESYNFLISNLTLVGHIFIAVTLIGFVFRKCIKNIWKTYVDNNLFVTLFFSLSAFLGSLFYSVVIGFQPCSLCYWQRIFMYPMLFLSALSLIKKDKLDPSYLLMFSGIGSLISIYHIYIQFTPNTLPCSTTGQGVSCSENWVLEYGYITIPVMALTCFLNIFLVNLFNKVEKNKSNNNNLIWKFFPRSLI